MCVMNSLRFFRRYLRCSISAGVSAAVAATAASPLRDAAEEEEVAATSLIEL
jgi:hypothetical protein